MNINGRISNSSIPAFRAILGSNGSLPTIANTRLFSDVPYNNGSHYTPDNGRFTEPYVGLYFFMRI